MTAGADARQGWWLYLLECGDGSFYAGIAVDVEARLHAHASGKGAKYTRGRGPLRFKELEQFPLIMPQSGQIFRKLMEAQATLSQVKLNVVWEVSSVPAILDLVRGGYGYAALTDSAMRGHDMDASLVGVPIKSPHIVSTLCLVQSTKKMATPLIRRTAELLRRRSLQVCAVEGGSN